MNAVASRTPLTVEQPGAPHPTTQPIAEVTT